MPGKMRDGLDGLHLPKTGKTDDFREKERNCTGSQNDGRINFMR